MGFFSKKQRPADVPAQGDVDAEKGEHNTTDVATNKYDSDSTDTNSLEARNEIEVQQHPDQITADAHIGVQKAEAAALVWGKTALFLTYAWCVSTPSNPPYRCNANQEAGSGWWSSC
jgi:hypothetical protein